MPVFNTGTWLHHLKLGSNTGYTTIHNIIEIYHWGIAYQLQKSKITISKMEYESKSVHNTK